VADSHEQAQVPPHQRRNAAQQNVVFTAVLYANFMLLLLLLLLLLRFIGCSHGIFNVNLAVLQLHKQPCNHTLQPKAPAHVRHVPKPATFLVMRQNPRCR
jgi:hypothetical protein